MEGLNYHVSPCNTKLADTDILRPIRCCICYNNVEFYELRQCSDCRSDDKFYCIRHCSEPECHSKDCTEHLSCWDSHLPRNENARKSHQMIDLLPQLYVNAVTYSEPDAEAQRALHEEDHIAQWFTIRPQESNHDVLRLCVFDRFRQLCNPGTTDNRWISNEYPSFVSFIGDTCVGKSTLLRAMLLMGKVEELGLEESGIGMGNEDEINGLRSVMKVRAYGPVTRTAHLAHLTDPTSLGVHLYRDPFSVGLESRAQSQAVKSRSTPMLFADCEGFRSGFATTNAERASSNTFRRHDRRDESPTPPLATARSSQVNTERPGLDLRLISDEPITAAKPTGSGDNDKESSSAKETAELFYAKFLYAVSDVIVFVTKNDTTLQTEMQRLLEWTAKAVYKAVNQPAMKTLVIVRNMPSFHADELHDSDYLKRIIFNNLQPFWESSPSLREFVTRHNSHQPWEGQKINSNDRLLKVFFQDYSVVYIPDSARASADKVFKQYQRLRMQIADAFKSGQEARSNSWNQYNVPELSHILNRVFEHFRTSDMPFDFYTAARKDNPNPVSFADHIANFLRHMQESGNSDQLTLARMIAACLVSWTFRNLRTVPEPEEPWSRDFQSLCHDAFMTFSKEYQNCGFKFDEGSGCIAKYATHDHHCDQEGNIKPGQFDDSGLDIQQALRQIKEQYNSYYKHFYTQASSNEPSKPTSKQASERRANVLQEYFGTWRKVKSNKTCFACLQAVPNHVLTCGHGYCIQCVREFGKRSSWFENGWIMENCVLCAQENTQGQLIRLKPRCAGVRVLTLDGGGVRGIIELALLEQLSTKIGLGIPIARFFDLIVGTSTGGIIALGITLKEKMTLPEMKEKFIDLATVTFRQRRDGAWGMLDFFNVAPKLCMVLRLWDSVYRTKPLRDSLSSLFGPDVKLFSAKGQQQSTRVAVTSTKDKAATPCLITNYNRPMFSDDSDFEREDEHGKEMKAWEAGLATAAAPFYFRPFRKMETGKDYVDGALHANFPAGYALKEISRIWPGPPGGPGRNDCLDVLISVGTGIQNRQVHIPTALRIGGFEEICTVFHNNLDSERSWKDFEIAAAVDPFLKDKIHRLNARISGEHVVLDHHKRMRDLEDMVASQMKPRPDGSISPLDSKISKVADVLVASLFFFEPDEGAVRHGHLRDLNAPGPHWFAGSIRCRLRHSSPELKHLVNKVQSFWQTEVPAEGPGKEHWAEIQFKDEQRNGIRTQQWPFRIDCKISTFDPKDARQIIAVNFKGRPHEMREPISGFPVTLRELTRRALSD